MVYNLENLRNFILQFTNSCFARNLTTVPFAAIENKQRFYNDMKESLCFKQLQLNYTLFVISNTFISNARLKLAKSQAKAKHHHEVELSLLENFSLLHPRYYPKILGDILKYVQIPNASVLIRLYD